MKLSFHPVATMRRDICHVDEASRPYIDIDMEQLPDVESSQTENNYVFQYGMGRDDNTLPVGDNDAEEEQASRYPQKERKKPDMYAYIARKGAEVDSPSIEEALQSTNRNEWEQAFDQELKSLERNGT